MGRLGLGAALDHAGRIDAVAIHAYTRNAHDPAAITSDAWFPGREGKWHLHFRLYRDVTRLLEARGILDVPLYITESGNACDPPCNPYDDADRGYFVAMYREVDAWNRAHPSQLIRAVTPYRWTRNDDGSGRDFCIGCRGALVADMRNAVAEGLRWSDTGCGEESPPPPPPDAAPPPPPLSDAQVGHPPGDASAPTPDAALPPTADAGPDVAPDARVVVADAGAADGLEPGADDDPAATNLSGGCAQHGAKESTAWAWLLLLGCRRRPR